MTSPKNPEKSKDLRPLRIVLAVLSVILVILILDRLPTARSSSVVTRNSAVLSAEQTSEKNNDFYFMTGLLDLLESDLETRLESLGVPEEEYENIGDYLSRDEIFEIETKVALAASLEGNYVEATAEDLEKLIKIFNLPENYPFSVYRATSVPEEYKSLADLLKEYDSTLKTVEDYDVIE